MTTWAKVIGYEPELCPLNLRLDNNNNQRSGLPRAGGRGSDALSSAKVTSSIVSAIDRWMAREATLMCTSATS